MVDVAFPSYAFKALPALASMLPRTMPDRLKEVVNVRDFGATGDGSTNDSTFIQNAFDAAFKTSGVANGVANAWKNKAVYFPPGTYMCRDVLLENVYGARIYGAGQLATYLKHSSVGSLGAVLKTNGFANSSIENMTVDAVTIHATSELIGVDLHWDGPGTNSAGLGNILFINVGFGGGKYGLRIAETGEATGPVLLVHPNIQNSFYGIKQNHDKVTTTLLGGGANENMVGFWNAAGNCRWIGSLGAGYSVGGAYPGQLDLQHDSLGISTLSGFRSESQFLLKASRGKVNVNGVLHSVNATVGTFSYTVDGAAGTGGPATVSLTGCVSGVGGLTNTGLVRGDVLLAIRATTFHAELLTNMFSSFTGKIGYWARNTPLTMATLPTAYAADGLMVNVSDAGAGGWGAAPGTGSTHALVRYNAGTSSWTVVGK